VKDVPVKAVFASYLIRVQAFPDLIFDRYLKLFCEQLEDGSRGAGQPNVNGRTLGNLVVPLPPLPEQHRIVSKVDELMALCDELEARIITAATIRRQFLEATLQGAFNGSAQLNTHVS
jgi:type I restriction enzyme S subunit